MKATGIVRRIDELGRVVIPKEIRRTMRIREGDPLEIYTDTNGCVIFRKCSVLEAFSEARSIAETIAKVVGVPCAIANKDVILEVTGIHAGDIISKHISENVLGVIDSRHQWIGEEFIPVLENIEQHRTRHIFPIISEGDAIGAIILFCEYGVVTDKDIAVANSMAQLIGKITKS